MLSDDLSLKEFFVFFIGDGIGSSSLTSLDHSVNVDSELLHGNHVEVVHDESGVLSRDSVRSSLNPLLLALE